jgi:uncharacterized membrane protein
VFGDNRKPLLRTGRRPSIAGCCHNWLPPTRPQLSGQLISGFHRASAERLDTQSVLVMGDWMEMMSASATTPRSTSAFRWPGLLIGIALGGFFDGLMFHEILEWHHMWSGYSNDPRTNMIADGVFHGAMYLILIAGLVSLWTAPGERRAPEAGRVFWGNVVLGFGLFNVVEGIIDHLLLGMHHMRMDVPDPRSWDIGFLVVNAAILVGGWLIARQRSRRW